VNTPLPSRAVNHRQASYRQTSGGRTLLLVILLLVLVAGGALYYFNSGALRISVSRAEILERLNDKLPITKTFLYVFKLTLESPRLTLVAESERVNAGLDISLAIPFLNDPKPLRGSVDASAGVHYSRTDGAIYLVNPEIDDFELEGLPEEFASRTKSVLAQGLANYFETRPIYVLSERQSHRAAKAMLQKISVSEDKLVLHLGPPDAGTEDLNQVTGDQH